MSAIVPTVGRVELLRACLSSIAACDPAPAELLVVDQSEGPAVAKLAAELGARHVPCRPQGIAHAMNAGLRAAAHDAVLRTDDDCTVAPDWARVAWEYLAARPDGLVTGRVLPGGQGAWVPSVVTDEVPREFGGEIAYGRLYTGNMAVDRRRALELGGLDERRGLRLAAEDNDFCFRWLRAGRPLRYEPAMVVWHHDWRAPSELAARYREYAEGQGAFYAKHLHAGDRRVLRWIARDLRRGLRAELAGRARGEPRAAHEARALIPWLGVGLVKGWAEARRLGRPRPG